MKLISTIIVMLTFLSCTTKQKKAETLRSIKPNIVFILIDDMGWKDVGFMGTEYYETPNIDRKYTTTTRF